MPERRVNVPIASCTPSSDIRAHRRFVRQPIGIDDCAVMASSGRTIDEKVVATVAADVTERHRWKCLASARCHDAILPHARACGSRWTAYAASVATSTGSTINELSFSGLLTRDEIGHM